MSHRRHGPANSAADIAVDAEGNILVVMDGKVRSFEVTSEQMRKFSQELAEAAVRKDLRS